MEYCHIAYQKMLEFCNAVFRGYGFTEKESSSITDVLLEADLCGIESHGIQRLIRYHHEITTGMVDIHAKPEIVFETPVSTVIDGHNGMGQILGSYAMDLAISKARSSGIGIVTVRNSNHYGIAGHYSRMAVSEGLVGMCMTNTEAIMVPTFGRQAMLGTNPISFAMPASPLPYSFDAATTVVPRGKLEVYVKRGNALPAGWALNELGHDSTEANRVLKNIIDKSGGGILPLGGFGEQNSGYKGYGFALLCEIFTAIFSGGTTSNHINKAPSGSGIAQCFIAMDHGIFGNRAAIEAALSRFLQEIRDSDKAEGQSRIYIHGEKEFEAWNNTMKNGIPLNAKTYSELQMIAEYTNAKEFLPAFSQES